MTPQREQALERIGDRQGLIRELATIADVSDGVIRGLVKAGAIEGVEVDLDSPYPDPDPDFAPPVLSTDQAYAAGILQGVGRGGRRSSRSCSTASPDRARPKSIWRASRRRSATAGRR